MALFTICPMVAMLHAKEYIPTSSFPQKKLMNHRSDELNTQYMGAVMEPTSPSCKMRHRSRLSNPDFFNSTFFSGIPSHRIVTSIPTVEPIRRGHSSLRHQKAKPIVMNVETAAEITIALAIRLYSLFSRAL